MIINKLEIRECEFFNQTYINHNEKGGVNGTLPEGKETLQNTNLIRKLLFLFVYTLSEETILLIITNAIFSCMFLCSIIYVDVGVTHGSLLYHHYEPYSFEITTHVPIFQEVVVVWVTFSMPRGFLFHAHG